VIATTFLHPYATSQAGKVLISSSSAFLLCVFLGPKFIDWLRDRSFGANIREEGPEGHKHKEGTPTMGGLLILISFAIPYLALSTHSKASMGVFLTAVACGLVGFADDYIKIFRKRSLGLSGRMKLAALLAISVGLWYFAVHVAHVPTSVSLRPLNAHVDLGPFYVIFVYLVVAGTTNAVNLTDGLDGLAAGCVAIAMLAYIGICFVTFGYHDLELEAGCISASCIGFLWFNSFPASIFMGDVGALALGGALAAMAIMTDTSILLIIIGGIFVIEALSVLIQVFSFQRFRKRVFKMAPIHHHFEFEGWSETKIMLRFWIVAAACGAIGFTLYEIGIKGISQH
jgi:phospho-N-acetylmuramoyl-pentapeptide-transferase